MLSCRLSKILSSKVEQRKVRGDSFSRSSTVTEAEPKPRLQKVSLQVGPG